MKPYVKLYFDYFGIQYDESGWHDFIRCEICGSEAKDIHHVDARGMGGSKSKDKIENLMAVCRNCHEKFGDKREYKTFLKDTHQKWMQSKKQK